MAGKRHHIIPQFLQKGFASRIEGETVWLWHYFKGASDAKEISTRDAIVSEHFYGRGEFNADPVITEFEGSRLSPLVEGLRNGSVDPNNDVPLVAAFIGHFCIRTKNIRKSFESISERFLGGMGEIFRDENLIWDAVASQPDSSFAEYIHEALEDSPIPTDALFKNLEEEFGVTPDDVTSLLTMLMREQLSSEELRTELREGVASALSDLPTPIESVISNSIKDGHVKSLKESVVPDVWAKAFEKFNWNIQDCNFEVILGDSGTVFRSSKYNSWVSLCEPDDIEIAALPLSRDKILIGRASANAEETLGPEINAAIASCSCEQFLSSTNSKEIKSLIDLIGTSPEFMTDEQIAVELDDIRANLKDFL